MTRSDVLMAGTLHPAEAWFVIRFAGPEEGFVLGGLCHPMSI